MNNLLGKSEYYYIYVIKASLTFEMKLFYELCYKTPENNGKAISDGI